MAIVKYYVSKTNGNNTYDGTSPVFVSGTTGPKLTIGAMTAAVPNANGDYHIYVAPGLYSEALSNASFAYSGAASKPNKIIADVSCAEFTTETPGDVVLYGRVAATGFSSFSTVYFNGISYWDLVGIKILPSSNASAIQIAGASHHNRFYECYFGSYLGDSGFYCNNTSRPDANGCGHEFYSCIFQGVSDKFPVYVVNTAGFGTKSANPDVYFANCLFNNNANISSILIQGQAGNNINYAKFENCTFFQNGVAPAFINGATAIQAQSFVDIVNCAFDMSNQANQVYNLVAATSTISGNYSFSTLAATGVTLVTKPVVMPMAIVHTGSPIADVLSSCNRTGDAAYDLLGQDVSATGTPKTPGASEYATGGRIFGSIRSAASGRGISSLGQLSGGGGGGGGGGTLNEGSITGIIC